MSYFVLPGQLGASPTTCPEGTENVGDGFVVQCVSPWDAERIRAERARALLEQQRLASTPAWVYWARVGGILAGVGVLVGLAWYSTRKPAAMRANHAPPGWAGSKRTPSRDDWVVVWLFENGTSSEGRFERYVSQDEIVAWSRPLLNSGLVSIMLTRPKDRSVVWSWKAPPGLV